MTTYYILKVKGKANIPDYIQLRDADFTLIGYFRPGRKERLQKVVPDERHAAHIQEVIDELDETGKMTQVDVPD
ncbi:MAG: fructose-6-phosphate aldolase [Bacteroidota bacterium]